MFVMFHVCYLAMMNTDSHYTKKGPDYFAFQPRFGYIDFNKWEQNKMTVPWQRSISWNNIKGRTRTKHNSVVDLCFDGEPSGCVLNVTQKKHSCYPLPDVQLQPVKNWNCHSRTGLVSQELDWSVKNWTGQSRTGLVSQELDWSVKNWTGQSRTGLVSQELDWSDKNWTGQSRIGLVS